MIDTVVASLPSSTCQSGGGEGGSKDSHSCPFHPLLHTNSCRTMSQQSPTARTPLIVLYVLFVFNLCCLLQREMQVDGEIGQRRRPFEEDRRCTMTFRRSSLTLTEVQRQATVYARLLMFTSVYRCTNDLRFKIGASNEPRNGPTIKKRSR